MSGQNNFSSIDYHSSPIHITTGLEAASNRDHTWYSGQKKNRQINESESRIDWLLHYRKEVKKKIEANIPYIFDYVPQHREEIPVVEGALVFSHDQFRHLVLEDHSGYRPNRSQPAQNLEDALVHA